MLDVTVDYPYSETAIACLKRFRIFKKGEGGLLAG